MRDPMQITIGEIRNMILHYDDYFDDELDLRKKSKSAFLMLPALERKRISEYNAKWFFQSVFREEFHGSEALDVLNFNIIPNIGLYGDFGTPIHRFLKTGRGSRWEGSRSLRQASRTWKRMRWSTRRMRRSGKAQAFAGLSLKRQDPENCRPHATRLADAILAQRLLRPVSI